MTNKAKTILAYLGLIAKTLIIGLSFIFLKIALKHAGAIDLLAHRFTVAFVFMIVMRIFGLLKFPKFDIKKSASLLLLSLFYPVLFFMFQTFGMLNSSASEAGIVFSTIPIFTLLAAAIFLKEKTSLLQKFGVLLSVLGIIYIVINKSNFASDSSSVKSILILLLSVFSIIAYFILGKKLNTKFSAMDITVWMTLIGFFVFNALSIVLHINHGTISQFFSPLKQTGFLLPILYLGILSSFFTSFFGNYALPVIPASQIAIFNNASPVMAIIAGVLFLNEKLYSYHIIGAVLVLLGIVVTLFLGNKNHK